MLTNPVDPYFPMAERQEAPTAWPLHWRNFHGRLRVLQPCSSHPCAGLGGTGGTSSNREYSEGIEESGRPRILQHAFHLRTEAQI